MSTILHIYLQFVYKTANTIHIGINLYKKYIPLGINSCRHATPPHESY